MRGAIITQILDEADPVLGFVVGWVNTLAARVEGVEVICLRQGEAALAPNVRVTVLPRGRFARYRRVRSALRRLKHEGALDFVFAHMCPSYAVAATFPAKRAPTFLWYAHSSVTRMLRAADRRCDGVFSCSEASYPLTSRRLSVVGHGIDAKRFIPPPGPTREKIFTICSVGRITKSKRLDLLVHTLARCRERRPEARLACRIVGPADEPYREELASLIKQLGLDNRIQIDPPRTHEEVGGVYQAADVIANMTRHHSLDKATLEAMACGCLVLTTNDAFSPVLGEHAALMVQPEASPEALAGAIERLAALSAEQRRTLGLKLREIVVGAHSLSRMMDGIVAEMSAHVRGQK